jgi:hypothetical protein
MGAEQERSDVKTVFGNLRRAVEDARKQVSGEIYEKLIESLLKLEKEIIKDELTVDTGQEEMVDKS